MPKIDPTRRHGRWEGWGASLSWWANVFGQGEHATPLVDLFFTTKTVSYRDRGVPGLGLNIARFNAGASSWDPVGGRQMFVPSHIPRYKQLEGYWKNDDPDTWDWWVDSEQGDMMWRARDRGADTFELFSCSPMWWMCADPTPCGRSDGDDNLLDKYQRHHAQYLATVAKYARDKLG